MKCNTCNSEMEYDTADLWVCFTCGLVASDLHPDVTLYDRSYLRKYERYEATPVGENITLLRANVVSPYVINGNSILDFGCGSGAFIKECRFRGFPVKGFDINPHSEFCDISHLFNGHAITTFWDSLEHVSNPKAVLSGLGTKYVFICAPSTDDFKGMPLTEWHHYYPHEHMFYYNERSLTYLLAMCGYKVILVSYEESKFRKSGGDKNILTIGGVHGTH